MFMFWPYFFFFSSSESLKFMMMKMAHTHEFYQLLFLGFEITLKVKLTIISKEK